MIAAVVLAAGFSRRMGTNKLHLPVRGKALFMYAIDRIVKLPFAQRIVVTNDAKIAQYAQAYSFIWVRSPYAAQGMGASVAAGAKALHASMQGAMFFNADQPFLMETQIKKLIECFEHQGGIVVPYVKNRPCSPCIFSNEFFDELCALTGEQGGKQIYQKHSACLHALEFQEEQSFVDLDNWSTYQHYK